MGLLADRIADLFERLGQDSSFDAAQQELTTLLRANRRDWSDLGDLILKALSTAWPTDAKLRGKLAKPAPDPACC
jgi:hypothetical protein